MKKFFIPVLACIVLASCSKSDPTEGFTNDPEEINMNVGITSVTRAGVISDGTTGLLPTGESLNVYFVRAADDATVDWSTVGTVAQTTADAGYGPGFIGATINDAGKVTFKDPTAIATERKQYYNADPTLFSHLIGYYPAANLSPDGTVTKATWAIDGKNDVMVSDYISGKKGDGAKAPVFKHLLTWLEFHIVAESDPAKDVWGDVVSVKVQNIYPNVSTLFNGTDYNCTYTGTPRTLDTFTATDADPATTVLPVGTTATDPIYFSQALVNPISGLTTSYKVEVVTTKYAGPYVLDVSFGTGTAPTTPGSKHIVTLTFKASEITANAKITAWVPGGAGSVVVD